LTFLVSTKLEICLSMRIIIQKTCRFHPSTLFNVSSISQIWCPHQVLMNLSFYLFESFALLNPSHKNANLQIRQYLPCLPFHQPWFWTLLHLCLCLIDLDKSVASPSKYPKNISLLNQRRYFLGLSKLWLFR
jgi:hypothetical protein